MKVIIREKEANDYGEGERFQLKTPKHEVNFGGGEPEDNSL